MDWEDLKSKLIRLSDIQIITFSLMIRKSTYKNTVRQNGQRLPSLSARPLPSDISQFQQEATLLWEKLVEARTLVHFRDIANRTKIILENLQNPIRTHCTQQVTTVFSMVSKAAVYFLTKLIAKIGKQDTAPKQIRPPLAPDLIEKVANQIPHILGGAVCQIPQKRQFLCIRKGLLMEDKSTSTVEPQFVSFMGQNSAADTYRSQVQAILNKKDMVLNIQTRDQILDKSIQELDTVLNKKMTDLQNSLRDVKDIEDRIANFAQQKQDVSNTQNTQRAVKAEQLHKRVKLIQRQYYQRLIREMRALVESLQSKRKELQRREQNSVIKLKREKNIQIERQQKLGKQKADQLQQQILKRTSDYQTLFRQLQKEKQNLFKQGLSDKNQLQEELQALRLKMNRLQRQQSQGSVILDRPFSQSEKTMVLQQSENDQAKKREIFHSQIELDKIEVIDFQDRQTNRTNLLHKHQKQISLSQKQLAQEYHVLSFSQSIIPYKEQGKRQPRSSIEFDESFDQKESVRPMNRARNCLQTLQEIQNQSEQEIRTKSFIEQFKDLSSHPEQQNIPHSPSSPSPASTPSNSHSSKQQSLISQDSGNYRQQQIEQKQQKGTQTDIVIVSEAQTQTRTESAEKEEQQAGTERKKKRKEIESKNEKSVKPVTEPLIHEKHPQKLIFQRQTQLFINNQHSTPKKLIPPHKPIIHHSTLTNTTPLQLSITQQTNVERPQLALSFSATFIQLCSVQRPQSSGRVIYSANYSQTQIQPQSHINPQKHVQFDSVSLQTQAQSYNRMLYYRCKDSDRVLRKFSDKSVQTCSSLLISQFKQMFDETALFLQKYNKNLAKQSKHLISLFIKRFNNSAAASNLIVKGTAQKSSAILEAEHQESLLSDILRADQYFPVLENQKTDLKRQKLLSDQQIQLVVRIFRKNQISRPHKHQTLLAQLNSFFGVARGQSLKTVAQRVRTVLSQHKNKCGSQMCQHLLRVYQKAGVQTDSRLKLLKMRTVILNQVDY